MPRRESVISLWKRVALGAKAIFFTLVTVTCILASQGIASNENFKFVPSGAASAHKGHADVPSMGTLVAVNVLQDWVLVRA